MGEVNVLPVEAAGDGQLTSPGFEARFRPPPGATSGATTSGADGVRAGHLVIRPESLRFLERAGDADNALSGTLYNEYSLGSRIQYQVRVGEQVFLVEKLREDRYRGRARRRRRDRLGRRRFHSGERVMAGLKAWARQPGVLSAVPIMTLLLLGFAAPLLVVFGYSFMPARTFGFAQLPTLENYTAIFASSYYQSFLWALFLALATVVSAADHHLSAGLRSGQAVRALVQPSDPAAGHPAVRLREHPALWLGAVPDQGRRGLWLLADLARHRAGRADLQRAGDYPWIGLRLPALHAVSGHPGCRHGADGSHRGGPAIWARAAGRFSARSRSRSPCPAS